MAKAKLQTVGDNRIEVLPMGSYIGAEIRGVDISQPLDIDTVNALRRALVEHKVIIFRDLDVTAEQHVAFGRYFGDLETHPFSPDMPGIPEMVVLDNDKNNPVLSTDIWHADTTFRECPTQFSILLCRIAPERGGDTMWANMVAAYEGLSSSVKEFIVGLEAIHDFKNFRMLFGQDDESRDKLRAMERKYPNPTHPVVRTHPETGERVLYVNPQFTLRITNMSVRESDAILNLLYEQAKTPEYQFRLTWEPGTLAIWDNRSTQHYAVNDYYPSRRRMERIATLGERPYLDRDAKPKGPAKIVHRVHAHEGLH